MSERKIAELETEIENLRAKEKKYTVLAGIFAIIGIIGAFLVVPTFKWAVDTNPVWIDIVFFVLTIATVVMVILVLKTSRKKNDVSYYLQQRQREMMELREGLE